jgi:hypothetical protein
MTQDVRSNIHPLPVYYTVSIMLVEANDHSLLLNFVDAEDDDDRLRLEE